MIVLRCDYAGCNATHTASLRKDLHIDLEGTGWLISGAKPATCACCLAHLPKPPGKRFDVAAIFGQGTRH